MKRWREIGAEGGAAIAAAPFVHFRADQAEQAERSQRGPASGIEDARQVLLLVYQPMERVGSIAAGSAALFALADGFF